MSLVCEANSTRCYPITTRTSTSWSSSACLSHKQTWNMELKMKTEHRRKGKKTRKKGKRRRKANHRDGSQNEKWTLESNAVWPRPLLHSWDGSQVTWKPLHYDVSCHRLKQVKPRVTRPQIRKSQERVESNKARRHQSLRAASLHQTAKLILRMTRHQEARPLCAASAACLHQVSIHTQGVLAHSTVNLQSLWPLAWQLIVHGWLVHVVYRLY